MNVVRHQVRPLVLGMVKLLIPLVKNVVLLIATKPAVIMELTLALMAVAENENAVHHPPQAVHHQVVALLHLQVQEGSGFILIGLILQVNVLVKIINLKKSGANCVRVKVHI